MKDMLQVNESGGVLYSSAIDNKYKALRCEITPLEASDPLKFQEVRDHVLNSQVKSRDIEVLNIFALKRDVEHQVIFALPPPSRTMPSNNTCCLEIYTQHHPATIVIPRFSH